MMPSPARDPGFRGGRSVIVLAQYSGFGSIVAAFTE